MNRSESKYFNTARRMDEALISLLLEKDFAYITVKDVCARAGVNRSTFYLHYGSTADLLAEAISMINSRFQESFPKPGADGFDITGKAREELFFITDWWLIPYLSFVRENRHVYRAAHEQADVFGSEYAYARFFREVFSPILSEYGVAEEQHEYIMTFYRYGLTAILMKWVGNDCRESIEEIAEIIKLCVGYEPDAQP